MWVSSWVACIYSSEQTDFIVQIYLPVDILRPQLLHIRFHRIEGSCGRTRKGPKSIGRSDIQLSLCLLPANVGCHTCLLCFLFPDVHRLHHGPTRTPYKKTMAGCDTEAITLHDGTDLGKMASSSTASHPKRTWSTLTGYGSIHSGLSP